MRTSISTAVAVQAPAFQTLTSRVQDISAGLRVRDFYWNLRVMSPLICTVTGELFAATRFQDEVF